MAAREFNELPVLALSGGVGGAKLALGLNHVLHPDRLKVIANTADDFEHLGFPISPDLDTVMYTLAGINNQQLGWGLANESWQFMDAIKALGGEDWFQLGDRDIATHTQRRVLLAQGLSLSEVTSKLSQQLGIQAQIIPMSDQPVATQVLSDQGALSFQRYFVGLQCQPKVEAFEFFGIDSASRSPAFEVSLSGELAAIIICPSNPFVSVDPILKIADTRARLRDHAAPVVMVSPIVGGKAIKGPAAKMLAELGLDCSVMAVLDFYGDLLDGVVIDQQDADLAASIRARGLACHVTQTVMTDLDDRIALAKVVLDFAQQLQK